MDMKFQTPTQPQPQPQQQESQALANPNASPDQPPQSTAEAPPKQVALALERLAQAGRLIADVRLGADRLLEALFVAAQPHQSNKPLHLFIKEDAAMRQHLQDLRTIGRQLEGTGVLNEPLRSRSNSWGLHMPLVCPDGAVVAYAWKRQLAGQAGASAVDRTRLALKAFTDQKKRFFPHLDDRVHDQSTEPESKKHCVPQALPASNQEELSDCKTLSDVLMRLEKEVPNLKIFTYERLDWLKRASSLPSLANESPLELLKEHNFHSSSKLRPGLQNTVAADKVAVIELLFPSIFRAIVSLHPVGSIEPDAVAFFSPDEEHAGTALQFFLGIRTETSLYFLLLLAMDKRLALLLPPVSRPYRHFFPTVTSSAQLISSTNEQSSDVVSAYHIGCFSEDAQ
ncbi:Mediator of RNA polymerase II transcription subunit 27 [Citrus sinensis]|uniref:Mediator of RNA polymerase II transcription subunit 27 n=1 Tax=Citrus sinensis TaxID=2711 RepID=A0ACB8JZC2_CITSI|nr:Mediator of RNA polymerase II transcription subunit 27 [Citrus sinensis]